MINRNLPKDWEYRKLDDICDYLSDGSHFTPEFVEHGIPFITVRNLNDGVIDFENCSFISGDVYDKLKKNCNPKKGDVLFSKDGTVGKVATIDFDKEFIVLSSLAILRPNSDVLNPNYLAVLLKTPRILKQAFDLKSGSAIRRIIVRDIKRIQIPLPPLVIQKRLVSILERAETLKQKRKQASEDTNKFVQSVFSDMFGGGKFPKKYIRDFVKKAETRDPRNDPEKEFIYVDIASVDNKTGKITETKKILGKDAPSRARKIMNAGDVIVSTVRPNLNATAYVPKELDNQICSTGFSVLRPNELLNGRYLYAYTRTVEFIDQLMAKTRGASYPAVSDSDVLNTKIPAPPVDVQNHFADFISKLESLKSRQQQSSTDIGQLFDSLVQRAFKGELA